jgi:hypothetical protein
MDENARFQDFQKIISTKPDFYVVPIKPNSMNGLSGKVVGLTGITANPEKRVSGGIHTLGPGCISAIMYR